MNTTIRQLTMQWWNPIGKIAKQDKCSNHYLGRTWQSLTGREIENIFYNEVIVKWWNNIEDKFNMLTKYFPNSSSVFDSGLKEIYLKEHTKEQPTENYRRVALAWWETLISYTKNKYFLEYQKIVFTPANNYTQLSGREIQNIWAVKTETKKAEMIPEQIEPQSIDNKVETIKSVTHCPTCGVECTIDGDRTTHFYIPKISQPKANEDVWDDVFRIIKLETRSDILTEKIVNSLKKHYTLIKKQ